jgi:predicted glycosyltransferase involved in capsule biosynthesis
MALQVGSLAHPFNKAVLIFSDVYCFGPLKKFTAGKAFATDADVKQAVTSLLQTPVTDLFRASYEHV